MLLRVKIVRRSVPIAVNGSQVAAPITCGLADVNSDSVVDGTDFVEFINSFSAGDVNIDSLADVAGSGDDGLSPDGIIDGTDFVAFINAFAVGC